MEWTPEESFDFDAINRHLDQLKPPFTNGASGGGCTRSNKSPTAWKKVDVARLEENELQEARERELETEAAERARLHGGTGLGSMAEWDALGPNGWGTVLTFFVTGLCQIAFGSVLLAQAGGGLVRRVGASLLILSGLGMAVLAFKTDALDSDQTWHGLLHVIGYFTFLFSLLLSYLFLAWGSWRRFSRSSWRYAPLALVPLLGAFALPDGLDPGNYIFFAVLLAPLLVLAIRVVSDGGWPATRAT